jgi:pilus assembly protein Flp/PilA
MTNVIAYVQTLIALKSDRRAVTALEYGMIAALIAAVIVGAVTTLGTTINTMFTTLAGKI